MRCIYFLPVQFYYISNYNKKLKLFNINLYLLIYYLSMALTYLEMYDVLRAEMTDDLYNWMKTQYKDVCSYGDVMINMYLDNLYQDKMNNTITILTVELRFIVYVYKDWKELYLKGVEADPWWAS